MLGAAKSRMIAAASVLLCVVFWWAGTVLAADKWFSFRTPHFEAVGNASKSISKRLLSELEEFRQVMVELFDLQQLERVPVTVILFENDKSFRPFQPLYEGKPTQVGGYFLSGAERSFIALNANAPGNPLHLVYHEYVHLITGESPYDLPLWLTEGLAEFYSTFEISKNKVMVGRALGHHIELLRRRTLLPLADLFQVEHGSGVYNEKEKRGIFYAQSWALAHWLMLGDEAVRRPLLSQFILRVNDGEEPLAAFEGSLGISVDEVEKQLERYIRNSRFYVSIYQLEDFAVDTEIEMQPLPEADVEIHLGDLLLAQNRADEAVARYEAAARLAPDSPRVHEAKGMLALENGEMEEAFGHFSAAVERGSNHYLVNYSLAQLQMEKSDLSPESVETIRERISMAIGASPGFAPAHYLKAQLSLRSGDDFEGGVAAIEQAIRLKPKEPFYKVTLSELYLEQGKTAAAREVLDKLSRAGSLDIRRYAQGQLDYLDFLQRREDEERELAESAKELAARDPAPETAPQEEDEQREEIPPRRDANPESVPARPLRDIPNSDARDFAPEAPKCKPSFVSVVGRAPIAGRMTSLDCKGAQPVFVVEIEGKTVRLVGADPDQFPLFSCEAGLDTVSCGPMSGDVTVYFAPGHQRDPATKAYRILAIEFRP